MCFATAKIPQGTAIHREMYGAQKSEQLQEIKRMTEEAEKAARSPLSVGKNRPRAKSNINSNI